MQVSRPGLAKAGAGPHVSGAIEPFVLLVKSTRGNPAALLELVSQVTGAPGVFAFGELQGCEEVQALARGAIDGPAAQAIALLRLFSYGTWPEYSRGAVPGLGTLRLSPQQEQKLKQLTVVSLAEGSVGHRVTYARLMEETGIQDTREMEDLVIGCMYAGVVRGKLDQRKGSFEVHFSSGRDVGFADAGGTGVRGVAVVLDAWLERLGKLIGDVGMQISAAKKRQALIDKAREAAAAEGVGRREEAAEAAGPRSARSKSGGRDRDSTAAGAGAKDRMRTAAEKGLVSPASPAPTRMAERDRGGIGMLPGAEAPRSAGPKAAGSTAAREADTPPPLLLSVLPFEHHVQELTDVSASIATMHQALQADLDAQTSQFLGFGDEAADGALRLDSDDLDPAGGGAPGDAQDSTMRPKRRR